MDITNNTARNLLACYEKTLDPKILEILDLVCEMKTIVPLQRAFRKKRFYMMWLPNGTCIPVYSCKTENTFTKQPEY